ncbi:MAG: hypothetical protein OCD76_09465 [Reichenbachiella sp.]
MLKTIFLVAVTLLVASCAKDEPCVDGKLTNCAISQSNFDALSIGMTEAEASVILGAKNKIKLNPAFPKKWDTGYRWARYLVVGKDFIAIDIFLKDGIVVKKKMVKK